MSEKPIFYDAKGRRRKRATGIGALLAAVSGTLLVVSLLSIWFWSVLPGSKAPIERRNSPPLLGPQASKLTAYDLHKIRTKLKAEIAATIDRKKHLRGPLTGKPVVAAFYTPSEEETAGLFSLRANASKITHLMPEWLHLTADGGALDDKDFKLEDNPNNKEVISIADKSGVFVFPILNNYGSFMRGKNKVDDFDKGRVEKLLRSDALQTKLIGDVVNWLLQNKFEGLNVDFENLDEPDYGLMPAFLKKLQIALHRASNLQLSVDLEASELAHGGDFASSSDLVVLMNYDEHDQGSDPGPIASIDWYTHNLNAALNNIPPEKLVVGFGNYAYDWGGGSQADSISYQSALMLARDARDDLTPQQAIEFDAQSMNSHFSYEDDSGKPHQVWLLDGVSAYNEWKLAQDAGVRGGAVWELGQEDPSIWRYFDYNRTAQLNPGELRNVNFPYEVDSEGEGDILTVPAKYSQLIPGYREVKTDPTNGLIDSSYYTTFPTSMVLKHSGKPKGANKNELALTFDDGPSSDFTGPILDTLEGLGVKGTFFLIGENAVRYPSLVRRMYQEGHEIGNHTFTHPDLGGVSDWRARLEIDATQRAIQSLTGHSTYLFRAPYNADSEPSSAPELKPILLASKLGYYTVGEQIDPRDWDLMRPNGSGGTRRVTAQEIADGIVKGVQHGDGNVILLHDAGGDRSSTIAALKIAIPKLESESGGGYRFVTVSELMGKNRDEVMPKVAAGDLPILVGIDSIVFYSVYWIETVLVIAFMAAIFLSVGRILIVTPLAVVANAKRRKFDIEAAIPDLKVAVVVAAFNEEAVIVRTVASVLQSDYKNLLVAVVDDGSKDRTFEVCQEAFGDDSRVTVVRQENGGKANALNTGMGALADADVYVYLDADTILAPTAISFMVRHFSDPKVGAVAGNVKVGNKVNLLTRLQAVEYVSSQNLDRRAYALLNGITVVPGAIGAWRKSAVESAGGYTSDTLAEDMDLTWRLRLTGWKIDNESEAVALTEAPDSIRSFFKQRFRWAFGTLQCLWKHRRAIGGFSWFGRAILPSLWVFQFVIQAFAPLVDLQLAWSLGSFLFALSTKSLFTRDWTPVADATQNLALIGSLYALFFVVEMIAGFVAFQMDRERKGQLWYLFFQRFFYRQIMYAVVWKSLWTAVRGMRAGWGKFERKGTVTEPALPESRKAREPAGKR